MGATQLIGYANADPTGLTNGVTRIVSFHGTLNTNSSGNEPLSEMGMRAAGTLDRMSAYVNINSVNAATVYTLRVSRVDTAFSMSVGASQTGLFENIVDSAAVVADDETTVKMAVGGSSGSINMKFMAFRFTAADASKTYSWCYTGGSGDSFSTNSVTRFYALASTIGNTSSEDFAKGRIHMAAVASNLIFNVNTNARITDVIVKTRKNGADGNQSVTVGAGQTGVFEDTGNTDTLAAGDDFYYSVTTSTGGGTLNTRWLQTLLTSTAGQWTYALGGTNAADFPVASGTGYAPPQGNLAQHAPTEALAEVPTFAQTISHLTARISSSAPQGFTIRTRIHGSNGSLVLSIGASQTGLFEDTTNSDSIAAGQRVNLAFIPTAGTGTWTVRSMTMRGENVSGGGSTTKPYGYYAQLMG